MNRVTLASLVLSFLAGVLLWRFWPKDRSPLVLPLLILTLVGIELTFLSYIWYFDVSECDGRGDVVCGLNENQGVLTFLTIILAVAAVLTAAIADDLARKRQREADDLARKREKEQAEATAQAALDSTLQECMINLIHVALCYKDNKLSKFPLVTVSSACNLLEPQIKQELDHQLVEGLDPLRRNCEYLQLLRQGKQDIDAELSDTEGNTIEERALGGFVNHTLRIMLRIGLRHEESWVAFLEQEKGLHYLSAIIKEEKSWPKEGAPANPREFGAFKLLFRSSEASSIAPSLRQTKRQLVCWVEDSKIAGLKTHCLCQPFKDLSDPPQP